MDQGGTLPPKKYHFHLKESSLGFDEGYLFFELEPVIIISYPSFSEIGLEVVGFMGFFLSLPMFAEVGRSKVEIGARTSSFFFVGFVFEPIFPIIFIS